MAGKSYKGSSPMHFELKDDFNSLRSWLIRKRDGSEKVVLRILKEYGERGVELLRDATPRDTGRTAESWSYTIDQSKDGRIVLQFNNSAVTDRNVSVVLLLQYGHATRNGGWVEGIDFINPALQPIFDEIAKSAWRQIRDL